MLTELVGFLYNKFELNYISSNDVKKLKNVIQHSNIKGTNMFEKHSVLSNTYKRHTLI